MAVADYRNHEVVNQEEIKNMFYAFRQNNNYAIRENIIKNHLKLVLKIANRYIGMGLEFDDIVSYGNIGLMEAVDKYNPDNEENSSFASYASLWIKHEIRRALDNSRVVYSGSFERREKHVYSEIRLDAEMENDENSKSLYDIFGGTDNHFEENERNESFKYLFKEMDKLLSDIEKSVIMLKYFQNITFENIGKRYGFTKQRTEQIEKQALRKLRSIANDLF
jgi:RNA polymerase sigma factor (sigma-70 family)